MRRSPSFLSYICSKSQNNKPSFSTTSNLRCSPDCSSTLSHTLGPRAWLVAENLQDEEQFVPDTPRCPFSFHQEQPFVSIKNKEPYRSKVFNDNLMVPIKRFIKRAIGGHGQIWLMVSTSWTETFCSLKQQKQKSIGIKKFLWILVEVKKVLRMPTPRIGGQHLPPSNLELVVKDRTPFTLAVR